MVSPTFVGLSPLRLLRLFLLPPSLLLRSVGFGGQSRGWLYCNVLTATIIATRIIEGDGKGWFNVDKIRQTYCFDFSSVYKMIWSVCPLPADVASVSEPATEAAREDFSTV
ncbi:hypothetical protein MUK42_35044 [Musa troglodytarum]|uniref:Secreted protein n=1 Tax=Musa troglodytarum TaxID=320322 RepID=A0A9E7JA67_9LILI|nr:hypothetical protein MUK42_35044 [Musa troglodytarum]